MDNDGRYQNTDSIRDDISRWSVPKECFHVDESSTRWAFLSPPFTSGSGGPGLSGDSGLFQPQDFSGPVQGPPRPASFASIQGPRVWGARATYALRIQADAPATELIEFGARAANKHNVYVILDALGTQSAREAYLQRRRDGLHEPSANTQEAMHGAGGRAREREMPNYSTPAPTIDVTPSYTGGTYGCRTLLSVDWSRIGDESGDIFMGSMTW